MDAHASVSCEGMVPEDRWSSAARVAVSRGRSTWIRPSGMPTGTESHEQMRRTGSGEAGRPAFSFGPLQLHRQMAPGGQQQQALAGSVASAQVRRSNPRPPSGMAKHAKMAIKERITSILALAA